MGTLSEDLTAIKNVEDTLIANKVARFSYTDTAYTNNDADGVDNYDYDNEQNIPNPTTSILKVNSTVLDKGYRAQASSITRMLVNHFFGRVSYNLNKINDNMSALIATLRTHTGTANGFATLDENALVPPAQLPKSDVAVDDTNKVFTAKGAFDYTLGSITPRSWLGKLFGHLYCRDWTKSPAFSTETYFTYGGGIIVARYSTTIKWSSDGINWNSCTINDAPTTIYSIQYVNDMFFLRGVYDSEYKCWWSDDGKVWTLTTGFTDTTNNDFVFAYGLGVFVCNSSGRMYWSEDGKTWNLVQGVALNTYNIIFANNTFVCGANGVWYSTDGKTWSNVNATSSYTVLIRNYSDGMWHAEFRVFSPSVAFTIWWSTNATTWTQCTGLPSDDQSITKVKDLWLCKSLDHGMYWSSDGKAWTQSTGIGSVRLNEFTYAGGLCFLTTGLQVTNEGLYWSVDGKAWTKCTGIPDSHIPKYANGLFITNEITLAETTAIYTSKDGKAWSTIKAIPKSGLQPLVRMYVIGVWLATISNSSGEGGVWWSSIDQIEEEGAYIQ